MAVSSIRGPRPAEGGKKGEATHLLARDLRCRRVSLVRDDHAVADAVDVRQDDALLLSGRPRFLRDSRDAQVSIGDEPARPRVLLQLDFFARRPAVAGVRLEQFPDERVLHETRAPDHDAGVDLLVAVFLEPQLQTPGAVVVGPDAREVVLRLHGDALAPERVHRVLRQLLVEHGQHLRRHVVHGDVDEGRQRRVRLAQVFLDEVVQLRRELDARRPAAHDGEMEQLPPLLVRRDGQGCLLEALQDFHPDVARVSDVAQEVGVFLDPLDPERLGVRADGHHELVVRHVEHGALFQLRHSSVRGQLWPRPPGYVI